VKRIVLSLVALIVTFHTYAKAWLGSASLQEVSQALSAPYWGIITNKTG